MPIRFYSTASPGFSQFNLLPCLRLPQLRKAYQYLITKTKFHVRSNHHSSGWTNTFLYLRNGVTLNPEYSNVPTFLSSSFNFLFLLVCATKNLWTGKWSQVHCGQLDWKLHDGMALSPDMGGEFIFTREANIKFEPIVCNPLLLFIVLGILHRLFHSMLVCLILVPPWSITLLDMAGFSHFWQSFWFLFSPIFVTMQLAQMISNSPLPLRLQMFWTHNCAHFL